MLCHIVFSERERLVQVNVSLNSVTSMPEFECVFYGWDHGVFA